MRIVIDTNVIISALLSSTGSPASILLIWRRGTFDICTSPGYFDELLRVLEYPKISSRLRTQTARKQVFLDELQNLSIFYRDLPQIQVVATDPTDNLFIALALVARAQYIVTGDKHLLSIGAYGEIRIVTPAQFVHLLEEGNTSNP